MQSEFSVRGDLSTGVKRRPLGEGSQPRGPAGRAGRLDVYMYVKDLCDWS